MAVSLDKTPITAEGIAQAEARAQEIGERAVRAAQKRRAYRAAREVYGLAEAERMYGAGTPAW